MGRWPLLGWAAGFIARGPEGKATRIDAMGKAARMDAIGKATRMDARARPPIASASRAFRQGPT